MRSLPVVIRALKRHKIRVVLLVVLITLSMAVTSNAFLIVFSSIGRIDRASGVVDKDLFMLREQRIIVGSTQKKVALDAGKSWIQEDLAALKKSSYVASVCVINTLPLTGSNFTSGGIGLKSDQRSSTADISYYLGSKDILTTLGLRLVAGRAFNAEDVTYVESTGLSSPNSIIITQALSNALFPSGNAVGHQVYLDGGDVPSTIIGVVDRLQAASVAGWAESFEWNSVIIPAIQVGYTTTYAVRAKEGHLVEAMLDAKRQLYSIDRMRIIGDKDMSSFESIRRSAYQADFGVAVVIGAISVALLTIMAGGVAGASNSWVVQRRRQIGIRRALGATKAQIASYFICENMFVTTMGVMIGCIASYGVNLYLFANYGTDHLSLMFLVLSTCVIFAVSFFGALWSVLRSTAVPPMVATRAN